MDPDTSREIVIHPRSYSFPGTSQAEGEHIELEWSLRPEQAALILVDVWNWHYLDDALHRIEAIVTERLVPLVHACRRAGFRIIHAPGAPVAQKYIPGDHHKANEEPARSWPPLDFRLKQGAYQKYARPRTPNADRVDFHRQNLRDIHPLLRPTGDDVVIASDDDLEKLLAREQRLFLFYAGFHNNACLLVRDYGIPVMLRAGYETIVVRDCTTALESHETHQTHEQTRSANLLVEISGGHSISSRRLLKSLDLRDQT